MNDSSKTSLSAELEEALKSGTGPKLARFALACLGATPLIGGAVAGAGGAWSEHDQARFNKIFAAWLKLQEDEIREIGLTIFEVTTRLDQTDEKIQERLESPEYLRLVKKCFRDWSAAESEEKRRLVRNLLSNAAATRICTDDVVSMFITWIDQYSESHFAVIREIYKHPGATRQEVWAAIHGAQVRENSAEADLFKLLIHDLSTGHVIRQHREVDYYGNFVKSANKPRSSAGHIKPMMSAFDDDKQYELTELGKQFVHYTMNEVVPRIGTASPSKDGAAEQKGDAVA
jgi:hypothetical protein